MRTFTFILCIIFGSEAINSQGLIFDQSAFEAGLQYERERADYVPLAFSLKRYAPYILEQQRSTCVAYSTAYAVTIMQAIINKMTDQKDISLSVVSPHWIYYRNRDVKDNTCMDGLSLDKTMIDILNNGVPFMLLVEYPDYYPFGEIHLCNYYPPTYTKDAEYALSNKPDEIYRISNSDDIKSAISKGMPVVFGMNVPPSFEKSFGKNLWTPGISENRFSGFGHAMVVVGYDDKKFGGAFEIINSWGELWGDGGFIWIKYSDFKNYFLGGYALYKEPKLGSAKPEDKENTDLKSIETDKKLSKELKKKAKLSKKWTTLGKK